MMDAGARLGVLYDITKRLATFEQLDELLAFATRRLREAFGAEGASILLYDSTRREFRFPVVSEDPRDSTTAPALKEFRFPADRGVAGWVLTQGQPAVVGNVHADPRFFSGVDTATGMTTRAIIAAPMRSPRGTIGVVEVINPSDAPVDADGEFLDALASEIAVAYEKAELYGRLRDDLVATRRLGMLAAAGLVGFGALFFGAGVANVMARALPWHTALARPGAAVGLLAVALGVAVFRLARRARRS
jgi:GAF domain-containing protein